MMNDAQKRSEITGPDTEPQSEPEAEPQVQEPVEQTTTGLTDAFSLLVFSTASGYSERIWNSRDGIVLNHLPSQVGQVMMLERRKYVPLPDWVPAIGDRIFVDLTKDRAIEHAMVFIDKMWEAVQPDSGQPVSGKRLCDVFPDKESAILALGQQFYGGGGNPDLIAVTPAVLEDLTAARKVRHLMPQAPARAARRLIMLNGNQRQSGRIQ